MRKYLRKIIIILCFGLAILFTLYPFLSNYFHDRHTGSIVNTLEESAKKMDSYKEEIKNIQAYNELLANGHVKLSDPFKAVKDGLGETEYYKLANMNEDGAMGYIEIPSISVNLPIYHGTSSKVLEKGVGHLEGTSIPIGGINTHSVLTGHTGLSSSKLFTDLTELEEGDIFFVHVMGEDLAYQVSRITVVLPSELDNLYIETGKDLCTLVTCTPYGVNSHRLLVRGERTDYTEAKSDSSALKKKTVPSKWMSEYKKALIISVVAFGVFVILFFVIRKVKKKKRNLYF